MDILAILFIVIGCIALFQLCSNNSEVMEKHCKIECKHNIIRIHCC